jgi:ferrochelatase
MRCWHPRASDVIKKVREYNPEEIILLPLYPQYSASTSGSSINEWDDLCKKKIIMLKRKPFAVIPQKIIL